MKPIRQFTADEGDFSTDLSGPDAIEQDIDDINTMFDPLKAHRNGEDGGIKRENLANSLTEEMNRLNTYENARNIINNPSGNVNATILQNAINELDSEKLAKTEVTTTPQPNKILRINMNNKLPASVTGDADSTVEKLNIHKNSTDHDIHNKNIFYTKEQLQTKNQSQVHWENLINVPNLADNSWKEAVQTYNDLPITGNDINDMRVVAKDVDGHSSMYRCVETTGTINQQWEKIADLDWTNDHSKLVNLSSDDHPQYLNEIRGDNRYYLQSQLDTFLSQKSNVGHNHPMYVEKANAQFDNSVDFKHHQVINLVEQQGVLFPENASIGQKFYRTDIGQFFIYKGTAGWERISGRGAMPKTETFTATKDGMETFVLQTGKYELGKSMLLTFVGGKFQKPVEVDKTHFSVNVSVGVEVVAWFLENAPEVVPYKKIGNFKFSYNDTKKSLEISFVH